MKDLQTHLEQLKRHAAECRLISDLSTDASKRELFAKLADHHKVLADQIEEAIRKARASASETGGFGE